MARSPSSITPELKALREKIAEEAVVKLGGEFFEIEGTPTATVKYKDGSYKKKPVMPGIEFSPVASYVGMRGNIIFCFSPGDAQEYDTMEVEIKDLDTMLPLFGPAVAKAFDIEGVEAIRDIFDIIGSRMAEETKVETETAYENDPMFGRF